MPLQSSFHSSIIIPQPAGSRRSEPPTTLDLQTNQLPWLDLHYCVTQARHERAKGFELVAGRYQANYAEAEFRNRLLELHTLVCGHEHVEMCRSQAEQVAILLAFPTLLEWCGLQTARDRRPGERRRTRQAARVFASKASFASSNAASACLRVTVGKPRKKSDRGCPDSR